MQLREFCKNFATSNCESRFYFIVRLNPLLGEESLQLYWLCRVLLVLGCQDSPCFYLTRSILLYVLILCSEMSPYNFIGCVGSFLFWVVKTVLPFT
jgi:hypothetical protein